MLLSRDSREVFEEAADLGVEDQAEWSVTDEELLARLRLIQNLHRARTAERRAIARLEEVEASHRKALAAADGRYRQLVETWPDMLVMCAGGRVTAINAAGQRLLGETISSVLLGKPVESMVHTSFKEILKQMVTGCQSRGEGTPYKLMKLKGPEGHSVHVEAAAICFEGPNGRRVLLVLRDVGEREHLSQKFQKAERLEAVGQLAGGVAHDFNNILTTIRGYSDVVLDSLTEGDPLAEEMREIKNATERAASLTRQLLAFSRRQVMEPAPLDLNKVVLDIKRMLMRIIGEHIELTTDLEPDLGVIRADRSQIEQVIMNLAINARDAIPERGTVALSTSNVTVGDTHAGLELAPGPYVLLRMSDTGVGMTEETALRIFEPFFTTKETDKGTGLGLSTVYGIVKQSGGEIAVESRVGEGTTFDIYLPIRPDLDAAMAPVRTEQGPTRGWETILLVEDESTVRYLAKRLLERAGYTVIPAEHGAEALKLSETHEGPIHVVVTDVVMPEMGGLELVRQLLEKYPKLKIILMSGYSEEEPFDLGDAPVSFLQKPFSYKELTVEVRRLLDEAPSR